ncbi:MAG: PDZ domain-containing protein [Bacteroidota bacterium]|nr:PDZ domain-containing protein [Bacteroidota bacterium]
MVNYKIKYSQPHKHILEMEATFLPNGSNIRELQLAAWRPGRYELQNYAQNILNFQAKNEQDQLLLVTKTNRNTWQITSDGKEKMIVTYKYYAKQMDAGGSWLDEEMIYLNFINFVLKDKVDDKSKYHVLIKSSNTFSIACSLKNTRNDEWLALEPADYYTLSDSPFLAAKNMLSRSIEINNIKVEVCISGLNTTPPDQLFIDFQKFCESQIKLFKSFPTSEYCFIIIILPYPHYHGVEHQSSTVIVLGNNEAAIDQALYKSLMGISSHEFFHAWNICQIKPQELVSKDFSKEIYFDSCFIAEGITTYYGDLMLLRSGVWDLNSYLVELSDNLQKHMNNQGRNYASLAQSSIDLWVDGYKTSPPGRKVSVYDKGALVAFILDMNIRISAHNKLSLDNVMQKMYTQFNANSNKGYTISSFKNLLEHVCNSSFDTFFEQCIYGIVPLEMILARAASWIGIDLIVSVSDKLYEHQFGLKVKTIDNQCVVYDIHPGSPADKILDIGDKIVKINRNEVKESVGKLLDNVAMAEISIIRNGKSITKTVIKDGGSYFMNYKFQPKANPTEAQIQAMEMWKEGDIKSPSVLSVSLRPSTNNQK